MKHILIIIILLLSVTDNIKAQAIENDSLLLQLNQELPFGWAAKIVDSVFSIEYKDSTWVAHGNWINANYSKFELKRDSVWITTSGRKVKMIFEFQLLDKMDAQSIEKLTKSNEKYRGRWAHSIYNSQYFTLLQLTIPAMDDQYNAVWPSGTGVWEIRELLRKYLSIN